jgi:hypothetical protein
MLDTTSLPANLRPLLELYSELFFEAAVVRDGKRVPHEQVVRELEKELVSYDSEIGFGSRTFVPGSWGQLYAIGERFLTSLCCGNMF